MPYLVAFHIHEQLMNYISKTPKLDLTLSDALHRICFGDALPGLKQILSHLETGTPHM